MKLAGAILTILLLFRPNPVQAQDDGTGPDTIYSVSDLQSDLRFLHVMLEKIHPNLYLYTTKHALDLYFDSLEKAISKPVSSLAFYDLISTLHSKIRDGHTMILPADLDLNYFKEKGRFIPLDMQIHQGHLYAVANCSADTSIKAGVEILGINGKLTRDIIDHLVQRQIRDGYNLTYPLWILNTYFPNYYQFSYGQQGAFQIVFKNSRKQKQSALIPALSKDSIRLYRKLKYAVTDIKANPDSGISFTINSQSGIATLVIKSFDDELLSSKYHQDFSKFIPAFFASIRSAGIKTLVLDLRNNQGGDFEPGRLLLRYLILQPMVYLAQSNEQKRLEPDKNAYKGKLYVLINGGSFSSTGIVSSYLDEMHRAIFIGEEAGGNKTIISGDPTHLILPKTKINVDISTRKYLIRNTKNDGHGILPRYPHPLTLHDIIADKDGTMEFALWLASKDKNLR